MSEHSELAALGVNSMLRELLKDGAELIEQSSNAILDMDPGSELIEKNEEWLARLRRAGF